MHTKEEEKIFKVCYVYDTETCNLIDNKHNERIAFPILFIFNDITATGIGGYTPDSGEIVEYIRTEEEAIEYIESCVQFGKDNGIVPVMCLYNAMFDLLPLLENLGSRYAIDINAQSTTSIYTMDLLDKENPKDPLLRFWDTSYLEPRGLAAMGESAGIEKALGDWDYDLVRTPYTELTEDELYYAKRDVQVIPAYLRWLMESNPFIDEEDFGSKLITKTSLIRLYGKRVTGELISSNGKSVRAMMHAECSREKAKTWESYAIRKASFRGGLTFTSANYASKIHRNIVSMDVVSMHHAFINGRYVPCKFTKLENPSNLNRTLSNIRNMTIHELLASYHLPIMKCFHACVKIKNLRPKAGSVFDKAGIATLAESKFYKNAVISMHEDEKAKAEAELALYKRGYKDRGLNVSNYYGKIYAADEVSVYVTEIEWLCICMVYDFDDFECVDAEISYNAVLPPDYVCLLSNSFFEQKSEMKDLIKKCARGDDIIIPENAKLPHAIYKRAMGGNDELGYLEKYYQIIVKGQFNAIYGSQAQDVNKPSYRMSDDSAIEVDTETIKTPENYDRKGGGLVNYNYGSRIVAGSRLHLLVAIYLLDQKLGDRIRILGGDTDSLKISCDDDVSNEELLEALEPLHYAIRRSIARCQKRIRKNFPEYASTLDKIGEFEIENEERYSSGMEYWNKCRMSRDSSGFHITCAGVSRPDDKYNLEDIANRMLEYGIPEDEIYDLLIGYNTTYLCNVSHLLGHSIPSSSDIIDRAVRDYRGKTMHVKAHRSICLFAAGKTIGNELTETNYKNIVYQKLRGNNVNIDETLIWQDESYIYIERAYTLLHKIPKH